MNAERCRTKTKKYRMFVVSYLWRCSVSGGLGAEQRLHERGLLLPAPAAALLDGLAAVRGRGLAGVRAALGTHF